MVLSPLSIIMGIAVIFTIVGGIYFSIRSLIKYNAKLKKEKEKENKTSELDRMRIDDLE